MKNKEAKQFIGKVVEWDVENRVSIITRRGTVEEIKGKNICIDGDWKWLPDIKDIRLATLPTE